MDSYLKNMLPYFKNYKDGISQLSDSEKNVLLDLFLNSTSVREDGLYSSVSEDFPLTSSKDLAYTLFKKAITPKKDFEKLKEEVLILSYWPQRDNNYTPQLCFTMKVKDFLSFSEEEKELITEKVLKIKPLTPLQLNVLFEKKEVEYGSGYFSLGTLEFYDFNKE